MKKINYILTSLLILFTFGSVAQELAPDQNPNYRNSAEKYAQQSDELTATQSTTQQETYKAYDWREAKAEKQQLRRDRQYELRKLRYQSRNRCCNNQGWNNGNYYNNGWNNGFYNNGYYNAPTYNSLLWGAGLYYLLN